MTVSQRHAEWISLLEVSGPFLAVAVLEDVFPQGLDKVTTPFRQRIRAAYEEWRDAVDESDPQTDAIHSEWVRLVVQDFLEYDPSVLKSGSELPAGLLHHDVQSDVTFRPDYAVMAGNNAKLLISVTLPGVDLENPLPSDSWLASPSERMISLCRTSGVPLGLVTNGERWMVVSAHGEGVSCRASWYARLWFQESATLQAFYSLLGVRRSFGEESQTLEALIQASSEHQDEITDTLGEQVRRAVEVLVQALDRADLDRNRSLLKDVTPAQLFEAGLTVMMRLVVVLCAEERKLLLLGEPVYDRNYAVSTLRSQLAAQASHGLELLERRQDAWSRLLATFRGIYGGISHETLRLPPLGGSLFDPDRFPFLEGRAVGTSWRDSPAFPLPIDNRTVLLLLNALQVLEYKSGARLLSYEALDVEQIGHVYEGLLERTVKRVPEITLGLLAASTVRKKTGHPEIHLSELEAMAGSGHEKLLAFVVEKTGRSKSAIKNDLGAPVSPRSSHLLLAACGGDLPLTARIKPFANLLRTDSWGDPLVYPATAFIVTHGVGRRETGSHYTPKSLTEPIVQHTLEPLAYLGPAEGKPRNEWRLRTPAELFPLKVCDMAMGSGAFLVQTCRWLAERLVEAWDAEEKVGRSISVEGIVLDNAGNAELLPRDQAERVLIARRLIASRCLYGVDINPMAVELAKLSLWLVTMMRNRPFSFLDHALKCGDSLLGVSHLKQLERFSLRDPDHAQPLLETANLWRHIEQAAALRRELEAMSSHTAAQIAEKARLHTEAETQLAKLRAASDFLVAAELGSPDGRGWDTCRAVAASQMQAAWKMEISEFKRLARRELNGRHPFHWPLEFPEVFDSGNGINQAAGFDAFVGNPPFIGNKYWAERFYNGFQKYAEVLTGGKVGKIDAVALFFRRAFALICEDGRCGLIATTTAREGTTLQVGFAWIGANGELYRAHSQMEWPGKAGVHICIVWFGRAVTKAVRLLDDKVVDAIPPSLSGYTVLGQPFPLAVAPWAFQGSDNSKGECFILRPTDSWFRRLREAGSPFLLPYVTGEDITDGTYGDPPRWCVDCQDLPLQDIQARCRETHRFLMEVALPHRGKQALAPYKGLVERWWQMWNHRAPLYRRLRTEPECVGFPMVSKHLDVVVLPTHYVFTNKVCLLSRPSDDQFAVLLSSIFEAWILEHGGTMGAGRLKIVLSTAIQTFPYPETPFSSWQAGQRYYKYRSDIVASRGEGLTKVYNRFHEPDESADDIATLRELHRHLDAAVATAYGWEDLAESDGAAFVHDFYETKQGLRWTLHPDVRGDVLSRLLSLNHKLHAEELAAGLHDKKGGKKKAAAAQPREPELALKAAKPTRAKPKDIGGEPARSSADVEQTELLNAIFTCAARREVTDRDDLARQVAETLGFHRLTANLSEGIASGINSAIRRGLVNYDAKNIFRVAASYADLDHEFLVKAINASVRSGCVYTPEEVLHLAADYLGCQRLRDGFRERLESALNAASRRGILIRRGLEIRKSS